MNKGHSNARGSSSRRRPASRAIPESPNQDCNSRGPDHESRRPSIYQRGFGHPNRKRKEEDLTVLEVGPVLGGGEVHLDVVEGLALAEVVVVGGGEEARAVPPHDGLQEPVVDVERQHLPPVHLRRRRRREELGVGCGRRWRWRAAGEGRIGTGGEVVADEIREVVSRSRRGADAVEEELFRRDSLPRQQLVRSGRGTSAVSFHSP